LAALLVNSPAPPACRTLPLHDALPILAAGTEAAVLAHGAPTVIDERWWATDARRTARLQLVVRGADAEETAVLALSRTGSWMLRSEEHTSELQSRFDLVCRLLLENKKQ